MGRTLEEIRASHPEADLAKIDATTEAEIRRHAIEDDEDPDDDRPFVKRKPGQRGPGRKPPKEQVTLRIEAAALAAWPASGEGWMTRAAEALAREAPKAKQRD